MSPEAFAKSIVPLLTGLAKTKYQQWKLSKDIERKVHDVFSKVSPNIVYLCSDENFCRDLFRLAKGEIVDAAKLVTLGESVQKDGKSVVSEMSMILGLQDLAYKLMDAWGKISQKSGDVPTAFTVFRDKIDLLATRQVVPPEPVDPETLASAEARYRRRIKEQLPTKTQPLHYIELSGETNVSDKWSLPPEFRVFIPDERGTRRVRLETLRQGVDKYPCIVLVGDPGCGKTTALEHLACEFADDRNYLPLPLRLNEFGPGIAVESLVADGLGGSLSSGHWEAPELAANIQDYLKVGKLFFMFDGLNEMPRKDYDQRIVDLRRFIDMWSTKHNRFLVTCRELDYGGELAGFQRVEVMPLNDDQIQEFLQKRLADKGRALWELLTEGDTDQRRILELTRNPYILWLMVVVFDKTQRLGRSRADLIDRATKAMLERAKRTCPPGEWIDADVLSGALAQLAFETQFREGFGTLVKTDLSKAVMPTQVQPDPNWPAVPSPPDQVLKLAASANIIEMTGDRSSLRFYHQLLQEYFAACEMIKRDPATLTNLWRWPWLEKEMPKWDRPDGNYGPLPPPPPTNWEETTILAAGLMPENEDQLVRALIPVNPVLAGRCLYEGHAEVAPDVRQAVVDRLLTTISDPKVALQVRIAAGDVLGYLGDPRLGKLVTIPSGKFLMGDDQEDRAKPQHEVFLPEYHIGKYPVTNTEFAVFIESGGYHDKRLWTDAGWTTKEKENWTEPRFWDDVRFNKPNQPIVGVSWYECLAYSRWLCVETGQPYRFPSEAEWEKAARGTDGRQYPWGERFEPDCLNAAEGDQIVESTTPVGIYPTGVSPYGCLDMAGNVLEWTSSQNKEYPYNTDDKREHLEADDDVLRVLRGGSWLFIQSFAQCSSRFRQNPSSMSFYDGFRVAVSPISAL